MKTLLLLMALFSHLNAQEESRQKILSLFAGEWVSRGLYVATKLEIADHLLSQPRTVEELASLSHSNASSLRRLLQMLTSHGIFEQISPDLFANTDASHLLTKNSPDSLRSLSLFYGEDIAKSWTEIFPSIQTGTPAFELSFKQPVFSYFKTNPDRAALFQEAMKEKSKAVIKSALSNYDFSRFTSISDVGGGYGQFLQAIQQKYPTHTLSLLELPEVIEKIKQPNIELIKGDFFISIPPNKDAYILKSVIHDWDDEKASLILRNCHTAMRPDSRLLLVEVVLQEQPYAHSMDFLMLAITGGKERSLAAMTTLLSNSGFTIESITPTATEFSLIEARKSQ